LIDEEVARILRESDTRAYRILEEHRDDLERVTEALIEREVLTEGELEDLVGKRLIDEEDAEVVPLHKDQVVASIDDPS
jgi:cell division protease FtsH